MTIPVGGEGSGGVSLLDVLSGAKRQILPGPAGRVVLDLAESRSFSGSGRPRGALQPSEKVGGFAPHLFGWF